MLISLSQSGAFSVPGGSASVWAPKPLEDFTGPWGGLMAPLNTPLKFVFFVVFLPVNTGAVGNSGQRRTGPRINQTISRTTKNQLYNQSIKQKYSNNPIERIRILVISRKTKKPTSCPFVIFIHNKADFYVKN